MKRTISLLLALIMALSLTLALPQAALATDAPINRAAVVQRLYELEGQPMVIQVVAFPDAAGNAATWAYGAGIVRGDGDGCFHGDRAVTRAELVTMLHRYAQYKGIDVSVGEDTNILSCHDAFDLPAWCVPAFQWACGAGVVEDDVTGDLDPWAQVTGAQMAEMLARFDASTFAPQRTIPIPAWYEDISGAAAYGGCGDHAATPYFGNVDVFDLLPTDSLTILTRYKTYQQTTDYTCGAASTVMLMEYYGVYDETKYDERSMANAMHLSYDSGIQAGSIAAYLSALGWHVEVSTMGEARFDSGDYDRDVSDFTAWVLENLQNGHPILVEWIDWNGHWQTIIGYDTMGNTDFSDDVLIMADSYDTSDHRQDGYYIVNAERFSSMWVDHLYLPEGNCQQYVLAWPEDADDALAAIRACGVLRVGATGDYRPMSFRDPETGEYWGVDAALAEDLAAALGVELEYVPTTWPTLMADTLAGKFDLAICGITVTEARKEQALMSDGYLENGKTVLCRAEDADKYISIEAINRPEVTVMENPGGLNEKFAREKFRFAAPGEDVYIEE